jgi:hypothetical protein
VAENPQYAGRRNILRKQAGSRLTVQKIRTEAAKSLKEAGYRDGSWIWLDGPNRLILTFRGAVCIVKMPGGLGRAEFARVVGYLQGLAEGARILERAAA